MDSKIIALIAAVAVVAAGGTCAYVFFGDDDGDSGSHSTDYKILDSPKNIRAGLVLMSNGSSSTMHEDSVYKVTSVKNGSAEYYAHTEGSNVTEVSGSEVLESIGFDFTDSENLPEGVDVSVSGDTYTITGGWTMDFMGLMIEFTYGNLMIAMSDGEAVSADGSICMAIDLGGQATDDTDVTYSTEDGIITERMETLMDGDGDTETDNLFAEFFPVFEDECDEGGEFVNADVTLVSDSVSFANVTVTSYHVTGDCGDYGSDEDITVYVYAGYIINISGTTTFSYDIYYS